MKRKWVKYGWIFSVIILSLIFAACPTNESDTKSGGGPIKAMDLSDLVDLPWGGLEMQTVFASHHQFTGTFFWQIEDNGFWDEVVIGTFKAGLKYRVRLTLTAKGSYTFTGIGANSFTHRNGTVTNPAVTGKEKTLTVTVTFNMTPEKSDKTVTQTDLTPVFSAPVKGGEPESVFDYSQYRGNVSWQTETGSSVTESFDPSTVYRAVVTLTPKTGWTLAGLSNGSNFTHYGAQRCSFNAANGTITITFRATVGEGDSVVSLFNLTGLLSGPAFGISSLTTEVSTAQYDGTVTWFYGDNTAVSGPVKGGKDFRAVVSLEAKNGFTFSGVPANIFSHSQMKSVNNPAGSGKSIIISVLFDRVLGAITYPRLTGSASLGASIKACCYPSSSAANPSRLINAANPATYNDGNNYWDYLWNGYQYENYEGRTNWPEFFSDLTGNLYDPQQGHPLTFNQDSVPLVYRRPAHVFTIDLGSKIDNIVSFGLFPKWYPSNPNYWPRWIQIFYSDEEIGPIPAANVTAMPEIKWAGADGLWREANLWELNGKKPVSARYIHLRIYMIAESGLLIDLDTTTFADNLAMGAAFAQIRIGVSDES